MKHDDLTVALIGCGFFARNHMQAWADIPGVRVVGVCDMDIERAERFAEDFHVDHVFSDAATMLQKLDPTIVDIATTVGSHRALVEHAVKPGRTVICQKPFAETLRDAAAMVAAADSAAATLLVHENFRWQKPFRVMRDLIEERDIGPLQFAKFSFRHGFDIYAHQPYLAEVERLALMDVGLHIFDLARHFMGEAQTISCVTQRLNPMVKGEDAFSTLMRHQGDGVSICDCSFSSTIDPEPFPETTAHIEGRGGTLILEQAYRLRLHTQGGTEAFDVEPDVPAWGEKPWHGVQDSVLQFQTHAVDVARGQANGQPTGADNVYTLRAMLAAYESARTESTVSLENWTEPTS